MCGWGMSHTAIFVGGGCHIDLYVWMRDVSYIYLCRLGCAIQLHVCLCCWGCLIHLSVWLGDVSYICLCRSGLSQTFVCLSVWLGDVSYIYMYVWGCLIHLYICMGMSHTSVSVVMSHTSVCLGMSHTYVCVGMSHTSVRLCGDVSYICMSVYLSVWVVNVSYICLHGGCIIHMSVCMGDV